MTKLDALKELLAKVYAGDRPAREPDDIEDACPVPARLMLSAFDGSLDAALALHEAVLPGWEWGVTCNKEQSGGPAAFVAEWGDYQNGFEATNDTPARAWLIVILKALIAMETDQ